MIDSPHEPDTFRALLIQDGKISRLPLRKSGYGAHHTHEIIGDTFSTCFYVPVGRNRTLVGYCDDEFLFKNLPVNVILTKDLYNAPEPGYPICGPIVVCANYGPDTVDMTEDEMKRFHVFGLFLHYDHAQKP